MRAFVLVMDSFGVGATPDADAFGDVGANTFGHIAQWCAEGRADTDLRCGPLHIPNLERLGVGLASKCATGEVPSGLSSEPDLIGKWAIAQEMSKGKDTQSGHWEIAGVPVLSEWGYFTEKTDTFPPSLLESLVRQAGLPGWLGNCHASGTTIIAELGEEHIRTGKPIFYTSSDSVFQIACHEETFGLQNLYDLCALVFEEVKPFNIGRVIARPFIGDNAQNFHRTGNRRDFSVPPPFPTVLEKLVESGGEVVAIGKIADIYAHIGISRSVKATGLDALWDATLSSLQTAGDRSVIMTNFVDFDQSWGHRRDVAGYAEGLELFDRRLPDLFAAMNDRDVVILTADHGCDPTWHGSDHTREYIPIMVYGHRVSPGHEGIRDTFADIGQSLAHIFRLEPCGYGVPMDWARSFLCSLSSS